MTGEVYKTLYGWSVDNLFANAVFQTVSSGLKNETYEWLETTVNNTAIMMTQGVRQLPFKADDGNWTYSYANGTTYNYETFYDIHFYYLGATHFVVGGSMVFMCLTIWLTRRDDPWKTSSLPLLFHGLTVQDRNSVPEVPQMVDMRIAADSMKVKMAMTPIGRRLATRDTIAS
ncbi:hypothetical protein CC78DRAFT_530848 [Lojkania enalia]|uniref:Uncharacterized protein n=1 Tax=Lojkania enalia TaxID=147567 RepID=A0A9P4KGA5_9PLEO|nr:hypothetical protein CC78DRAFT_530848 [Didymosphaeria enalia]